MDSGIGLRLGVQTLSLSLGEAGSGKRPHERNAPGPGQLGACRGSSCALPAAVAPMGLKGRRHELLLD